MRRPGAVLGMLGAAIALAGCSAPPAEPSATPNPPESPWRVLESVGGRFGLLEVLEHRGALALAADGVFQTVMPPGGIMKGDLLRGGEHAELIPWLRPAARSALLIGLGGGLHAHSLALYGIEVAAVDIDPDVVRLARERFGYPGEAAAGDGRDFLERDPRRFDAVIIDAFAGSQLPERLFTREAFGAAARRLAPGGILAIRIFGRPGHPAVRAVARTAAEVFPHVVATSAGRSNSLQSIWIFAAGAALVLSPWAREQLDRFGFGELTEIESGGAPVLTDRGPGITALAAELAAEHRRQSLAIRRNPPCCAGGPSTHGWSLLPVHSGAGLADSPTRAMQGRGASSEFEGYVVPRHLEDIYLIEVGGRVSVQTFRAYLGMVSYLGIPPRYRLSPSVAARLAPLVVRTKPGARSIVTERWDVPRTPGPIACLRLDCRAHVVRVEESAGLGPAETWEIDAARIVQVEFLTPDIVQAWITLDDSLRETVEESRKAPGGEKQARLSAAVPRGAAALEALLRAREPDALRATVEEIEPDARIIPAYSLRIAREWGGQLRKYAEALRLGPVPPMPIPPELGAAEIPGSADTGVPESWDEEALGVRLRKADPERCARDLVIRGTVVEKVLRGGRAVGLKADDLIVDYQRVYDLVMEGSEFESPRRRLENLGRYGGKLVVLREGRRVVLEVKKI